MIDPVIYEKYSPLFMAVSIYYLFYCPFTTFFISSFKF